MQKQKPGPKEKPYEDRKHPVTVYITGSKIKRLGGLDQVKQNVLEFLNK